MSAKATETLELRFTPEQVAAIRLRIERRKKNVGGTGELDLGDISSEGGSDSSNDSTVVSGCESS